MYLIMALILLLNLLIAFVRFVSFLCSVFFSETSFMTFTKPVKIFQLPSFV